MSSAVSGLGASIPQAWSSASMRTPPTQKMQALFQKIDVSGAGSITKAQFEQAFQSMNPPRSFQQAGVDNVWSKLDPKETGSVSKQDFVSGMTSMMSAFRQGHAHAAPPSASSTLANGLSALNGLGNNIDTTA